MSEAADELTLDEAVQDFKQWAQGGDGMDELDFKEYLIDYTDRKVREARIDEVEKMGEASKKYIDKLPDEPDYGSLGLGLKADVDNYNKKSSEYLDACFWFDLAFQPVHDYRRNRIAQLKESEGK